MGMLGAIIIIIIVVVRVRIIAVLFRPLPSSMGQPIGHYFRLLYSTTA
jgi:hypothetical protein